MEQIKFPEFIKLTWWANVSKEKDGLPVLERSVIKVNPMTISYYYPLNANINGNERPCTSVYISGSIFWIDISFDEFDELWETVKRSFDMKEDWQP